MNMMFLQNFAIVEALMVPTIWQNGATTPSAREKISPYNYSGEIMGKLTKTWSSWLLSANKQLWINFSLVKRKSAQVMTASLLSGRTQHITFKGQVDLHWDIWLNSSPRMCLMSVLYLIRLWRNIHMHSLPIGRHTLMLLRTFLNFMTPKYQWH